VGDEELVAFVESTFDIGTAEVFQRAAKMFNKNYCESQVVRFFMEGYMPFWVRHYCNDRYRRINNE
jgi:hypothetical protein